MTGSRGAAVAAALATASGPLAARGAAAASSALDEPAGWPGRTGTDVRRPRRRPAVARRGRLRRPRTARAGVRGLPRPPAVHRLAGGRVRARLAGARSRPARRRGRSTAAAGCSRPRPTRTSWRSACRWAREMAVHRHHRDGAEDRLRPVGGSRAPAGAARARRTAAASQTCSVTLLACHAVPEKVDRADWVRAACDELIPAAAAEELVDQVDIYVEDIAFSLDDLTAVAAAARARGSGCASTPISSAERAPRRPRSPWERGAPIT